MDKIKILALFAAVVQFAEISICGGAVKFRAGALRRVFKAHG